MNGHEKESQGSCNLFCKSLGPFLPPGAIALPVPHKVIDYISVQSRQITSRVYGNTLFCLGTTESDNL